MILLDFNDFPRTGRILGIDWGKHRTGVAVSDENRDFVFVRPVIVVKDSDMSIVQQVVDIAEKEKVVGIVIGLPLFSDGTESETTKLVKSFAKLLSEYTNLPIAFIDESFSSVTAQEYMGKASIKDIKQNLDSASARIILENAISFIKRLK